MIFPNLSANSGFPLWVNNKDDTKSNCFHLLTSFLFSTTLSITKLNAALILFSYPVGRNSTDASNPNKVPYLFVGTFISKSVSRTPAANFDGACIGCTLLAFTGKF